MKLVIWKQEWCSDKSTYSTPITVTQVQRRRRHMRIELVVGSLQLSTHDQVLTHSSRACRCFLVSLTTLHYKGMKRSKIIRLLRNPLCGLFRDPFPGVTLWPCYTAFLSRYSSNFKHPQSAALMGREKGGGEGKMSAPSASVLSL